MKKSYWKSTTKLIVQSTSASIKSKCYGKASQNRFSTKFKHCSRKMGSCLQMQSIMPEVNSKADKEEVVRKRHQSVCLTGFHKQYFPNSAFRLGKRDGTFLRDFHISGLVCFPFHCRRSKSKYDKWVNDVHKKQKVFGGHLSSLCNIRESRVIHHSTMKRNEPTHQRARAFWRTLYEILQCVNATLQM